MINVQRNRKSVVPKCRQRKRVRGDFFDVAAARSCLACSPESRIDAAGRGIKLCWRRPLIPSRAPRSRRGLLPLDSPLPAQRGAGPLFFALLHLSVQAMLADVLNHACGEQIMDTHSLAQELADSSARYVVRNKLADHVDVFNPVLSQVRAPLLQWRKSVVDRGSAALNDKNAVTAENAVEICY